MKTTKSSRMRRAALASLAALTLGAPCCGGGDLGTPAEITSLRVIGVPADKPYAAPGDTVTFSLTYADALGGEPREVEVMWLGGCVNPILDDYLGCFPQLGPALQTALFGPGTPGLSKKETLGPEQSGVTGSSVFEMKLSEDILKEPNIAESGAPFSTAYAFFIVCAGNVSLVTGEQGAESFPLECLKDGKVQGADSFVVGYTQVYVFGDGRTNTNPPVLGLTLDGADIPEDVESAPVVEKCVVPAATPEAQGCGGDPKDDCKTYKVNAVVENVAELDPESVEPGKPPLREAIWVDYFADKGDITGFRQLVSDTAGKYTPDHPTTFTPPAEPGLVTLWAVTHDAQGGSSVIRRVVRVE